jgi:uncharacterized protein YkwD
MLMARAAIVRKLLALSVTGLLVALSGVMFEADPASAGRSRYTFHDAERCMMRKINKKRVRRGKKRLDWDRQLGFVARRHAKKMGRNRTIFHDNGLGSKVTRWRRLGQNVGTSGGGCRSLFRAFMRSSPHRHNIMGRWRHVGVGSDRAGGRLYVMHVFEARRNPGNIYSYP